MYIATILNLPFSFCHSHHRNIESFGTTADTDDEDGSDSQVRKQAENPKIPEALKSKSTSLQSESGNLESW